MKLISGIRRRDRTLIRYRRIARIIGIGLVTFLAGVIFQDGWDADLVLPVHSMPPLETFMAERSFSETQNAKATLQALATVFLTEFRTRYWSGHRPSGAVLRTHDPIQPLSADEAVRELQTALREFEGTQQEILILSELLRVLRKEERFEAWLDIYLQSLYRYPTGRFVQDWAAEARSISECLDRADQLERALALHHQWIALNRPECARLLATACDLPR